MKRQACAVLLGAALLLGSQSASAQEATYVFSYEGFRYTQRENETVLTQTNLGEHEDLLHNLGTTKEAVLASYIASGIVMEVIPDDGGQIAVSVTDAGSFADVGDMDDLSEKAVTLNENAVMVCRKGEYFTDDEILKSLKEELTIQIRGLEDEISMIDEKLATYREDLAFVGHLADERHLDAADIERKLNQDLLNKKDEVRELQDRIAERTSRITHQKEDEVSVKEKLHELEEDKSILLRIKELSDLAVEEETRYTENVQKEQMEYNCERDGSTDACDRKQYSGYTG